MAFRSQSAIVVTALVFCASFARPALAEGTPAANARALFDAGRLLMKSGDYAEACAKFEQSLKLKPELIGTEFHLAECSARIGKVDRARELYLDVADKTHALGQADREQLARERAAAVVPTSSQPASVVSEVVISGVAPEPGASPNVQCTEALSNELSQEYGALAEATARIHELEQGLAALARARPRDARLGKLKQELAELQRQLAATWSLAGGVAAQVAARTTEGQTTAAATPSPARPKARVALLAQP
jgi:tetratricopeptide (TPR) repeat protein